MFYKIQYAVGIALICLGLVVIAFAEHAHAAPSYIFQKNIIPELDSTYTLGSSSPEKTWLNIFTDQLCLSGDCKTAWPTGGGGGGSDVNWTWNTSQNAIDSDGASTTATTSVKSNAFLATSTTINSNFIGFTATRSTTSAASSTNFFSSILTATTGFFTSLFGTNATITNATTTNLNASGSFKLGSDLITDLTGTGLSIVSGALTATNDHAAVTLSGTPDYITLSGQDIVRGTVDISDDTNLSADGTEIVLTGDALSLGTALTFTSATATNLATTFATTSIFYGAGLSDCDSATGALTWDVTTGKFGCNSITGGASADWNQSLGTYLTPSTTLGISVRASSTIGDGTGEGGLTINGNATSTGNFNFGNNFNTLQAGIANANYINASTTGRAGLTLTNAGYGSAPEYRFIVGDPRSTLEYLAFGMTNADATNGGTLNAIQKTDLAYIISNSGRDVLLMATGQDLYLGAGSTAIPALMQIDGATNRLGIGMATGTTPTSTLSVNGDIYYANSIATGTATATSMAVTTAFNLLGTIITNVATWFSTQLNAVTSFVATAASTWDFGGAGSVELPNGSSPTVDATGETAVDTTSDQFIYYGASAKKVLGDGNTYPAFSYSTSTAWTGTTTIPLGPAYTAETWNGARCFTDAGTLNVSFYDGTNRMNAIAASTTVGLTTLSTNNTFTSGEKRYVDIGTPASSPTRISCTVSKSLTAD